MHFVYGLHLQCFTSNVSDGLVFTPVGRLSLADLARAAVMRVLRRSRTMPEPEIDGELEKESDIRPVRTARIYGASHCL